MPETIRRTLPSLEGFASSEVASFLAQMDDQSRRHEEATRDMTPDELCWQSAPGMNTIGMLMAHNAIVEVFWTSNMMEMETDYPGLLGIKGEDDGMPLAEDGSPPEVLKSRNLAYFDDLLAKARAFCKEQSAKLNDSHLGEMITRTRPDGTIVKIDKRWILYHMLEHYAGHFGQILLLRHLYKTSKMGVR